MNGRNVVIVALLAMVLIAAAGCDVKPSPPKVDGRPITSIILTAEGEREAAQRLVDAQAEYRWRLAALAAYYQTNGALIKHRWAVREAKNLEQAHVLSFKDLQVNEPDRGPAVGQADEATLVERVVAARKAYMDAIDELTLYYEGVGAPLKLAAVDTLRRRFDPVRTYMYFLDAEVPPADLKPLRITPEAEQMYDEALTLYKRGSVLGITVDYNKKRQALLRFLELIRQYPTSTKIAYSAFYVGEIYRLFDEPTRAVMWYRRATQWDPTLDRPARFEAAKIAQFELRNYELALELYREVLQYETFDMGNVKEARGRIDDIEFALGDQ
ncbi:MAG: tetratricopeptide repeat protein [Planctomycetota bacterium]